MSADKLVDFCLGSRMEVLKFVHRLELDDIETVGEDAIRFAFEKMFTFISSDVRNGREDISAVRRGTLNTVSMVDTALSGFVVDVEILEIVVEINGAGTEVSP